MDALPCRMSATLLRVLSRLTVMATFSLLVTAPARTRPTATSAGAPRAMAPIAEPPRDMAAPKARGLVSADPERPRTAIKRPDADDDFDDADVEDLLP